MCISGNDHIKHICSLYVPSIVESTKISTNLVDIDE